MLKDDEWFGKDEEEFENGESPLGTPNKAEYQDYDRILSGGEAEEEGAGESIIENRYRKYFQE